MSTTSFCLKFNDDKALVAFLNKNLQNAPWLPLMVMNFSTTTKLRVKISNNVSDVDALNLLLIDEWVFCPPPHPLDGLLSTNSKIVAIKAAIEDPNIGIEEIIDLMNSPVSKLDLLKSSN